MLQDRPGTTVLHRRTAEISTGQISRESICVEATVGRPIDRHLAGYFLG
jgi:hypothetical protein